MNNEEVIVDVQNIGHYFGDIKAVDDISFQVKRGEVLGFLGPNGAGKSTTMRMLSCFITPTFGKASIKGYDTINNSLEVRSSIGYLPENAPAYEDMVVADFLDFVASVRGFTGKDKKEKIKTIISQISLEEVLHQRIETLSKGFKRRVCLAQAILHDPEVLILDEPTDGLDPNQKHEIRELIRKISKKKVIILSTHILEEVEEVCSRVIIIAHGEIKADNTPDKLRSQSESAGMVSIILDPNIIREAYDYFKQIDCTSKVESINHSNQLNIFPKDLKGFTQKIINECHKKSWQILDISVNKGNLAEVFRKITT